MLGPWLLIICAAVNSTIGNLLLKQSSMLYGDKGLVASIINPWFIAGMVFYGVNVILFARALTILPVAASYPVLAGLGFLLLSGASFIFLDEKLTLYQYGGMIIILVGIAILAAGGK